MCRRHAACNRRIDNPHPLFRVSHSAGVPLHALRLGTCSPRLRMKTPESKAPSHEPTPAALIDARIRELGDWRGETLGRVRALIREALKALIERESARRLARMGGSEPDLANAPRRRPEPA